MKKKVIIALVLAMFCAVSMSGVVMAGDDPCAAVDLPWLRVHVPIPQADIVDKKPVNGLCQLILKIQNEYVALYAGSDFVIAGEMFANKVQLTQPVIAHYKNLAILENINNLKTVVAIKYAPKNATGKNVYMLTDPICPYCNSAVEQLKALADESGTTFNLIFFNVHGDAGEAKIKEALCNKMDFVAYSSPEWKKKDAQNNTCKEASAFLEKTNAITSKLGVTGVPLFVTEDGQVVSGANIPGLKASIEKMNGGKTAEKVEAVKKPVKQG